jgi:hypothetical protein
MNKHTFLDTKLRGFGPRANYTNRATAAMMQTEHKVAFQHT